MKIGQEINSKIEQKPFKKIAEGKNNFEQFVRTESHKIKQEELAGLIKDITEQGEKIARFRSFKDLAKFKRMIKQFLQETVYNGLSLNESRSFNSTNYSHKLTTVQEVDEKLIQLTEDVIDQEKKTVDLLGLIGEIRGLLINITT
ncbi:YaaR family protein [Pseudogracilibacillus sp. SE30717A]|uniref:YaaR family protein n=1 Tax=Pseudogracilibacillus sp. SE30717A TaxID=3098293 RepID=UPI00300E189F